MSNFSILAKWKITLISLFALTVLSSQGCGGSAARSAPETGGLSESDDVSYLSQYGVWITLEPYGQVWQPYARPAWRPFAYGHWIWTDPDLEWVSYEPFGWLVYHYGNWGYEPGTGWFWVEGGEWSPAQVEWMNYDNYTCWAPIPPVGMEWSEPWETGEFDAWTTVETRNIDRDNIIDYRISEPPRFSGPSHSEIRRNPIDMDRFEKMTGRRLTPEKPSHESVPIYMRPNRRGSRIERHESQSEKPEEKQGRMGHAERQRVHLRRMILPERERARVEKHRRDVENRVLIAKGNKTERRNVPREPGRKK